MRLKSIYISDYKNLKDFSLSFEGDSFIDIFVGKNGCGKSNLLEALIEIFRHLIEFDSDRGDLLFNYKLSYEIEDKITSVEWKGEILKINGRKRKTFGRTPRPDNILIYYSGHNDTVGLLIEQYESSFRKRIKKADFSDSRDFFGIGSDYKALLLSVMLMQPETCRARKFVCGKLSIEKIGLQKPGTTERTEAVIKIVLERPEYAKGSNASNYTIENNDENDRYWKPEGITKKFLDSLSKCITKSPGELVVTEGYISAEDHYILYLDIEKINQEFSELTPYDLFRQFDNLKTLGLLAEISAPLQLVGGIDASISHFSDGQFQSVYIYAITELFKDKHCITLLDEPDSFLHPEWQFDFLKQVVEISDEATKTNHILMSSHSASTIASADERTINLLEFDGGHVVINKVKKSDVIRSLSAGLISFTEGEAQLNINHVLASTSGPVVFVEGITDEIILETAWDKLHPDLARPFIIQSAFCRSVLYSLFSGEELSRVYQDRVMFALFDFDEAYDNWNGLKPPKTSDEQSDPLKGLAKKLLHPNFYAMLLPVPDIDCVKSQVLDGDGKPWGRGVDSHLPIELLFYRDELLGQYFVKKATPGGGEIIQFSGNKPQFAKDVVSTFDVQHFNVFLPLFEFIQSKCVVAAASTATATATEEAVA